MMRLDKFLADAGMGTRTELKAMIRQGRVTVDGAAVKKPETKVDERQDIRNCRARWCCCSISRQAM